MIYCPRCAAEVNDQVKFCKLCGLPVESLHTYVAREGTTPLKASSVAGPTGILSPLQRLVLTVVACLSVPTSLAVCFALLGSQFVLLGDQIKQVFLTLMLVSEVVAIPVLVWAIFKYVAQKRNLQQRAQPQSSAASALLEAQPSLLTPLTTNPLAEAVQGSVTEEETRQLLKQAN
jgi:hypothetical protein